MLKSKVFALFCSFGLVVGMPATGKTEAVYPERPVRMIVPFPPGGSVDYIARIVMPAFAKQLGQPVVIENKGGASGAIGTADAARSAPDGYTLLMVFDTHAVNPYINDLSYDTFESFDYITGITSAPMVLVTSPEFPAKDIDEFIRYASENPGKVTYGSSGVGGSNHLTALDFSQKAGLSTLHVPYRGGGPMLLGVMRGEVDFVVTTFPLVVERINTGQLKAMAMGSHERVPQLPDVPATGEFLPEYSASSWIGLVAPKGTPEPILKKIHKAMADAMHSPEVHERLTGEGFSLMISSPDEFKDWVRQKHKEAGVLVASGALESED